LSQISILLLPFVGNFVLFLISCNSYLRLPLFRKHLWSIIYRFTGGGSFIAKNISIRRDFPWHLPCWGRRWKRRSV